MPAENVITVKPGPKLAPGQVAIWEVSDEHPDGEVYLAAPHAGGEAESIPVARTAEVSKRLSDGRLVEVGDDDEAPRRGRRRPVSAEGQAEE